MRFRVDRASAWRNNKYKEIDIKFNPRVEKINNLVEKCFIDINSLEDLMEFISLYGDIVMDKDSILIYDDYIE